MCNVCNDSWYIWTNVRSFFFSVVDWVCEMEYKRQTKQWKTPYIRKHCAWSITFTHTPIRVTPAASVRQIFNKWRLFWDQWNSILANIWLLEYMEESAAVSVTEKYLPVLLLLLALFVKRSQRNMPSSRCLFKTKLTLHFSALYTLSRREILAKQLKGSKLISTQMKLMWNK